jgi:translation initiation factor IF-2
MRPGMHPTSRTPGGLVGPGSPPPMPDQQQRRPGAYNKTASRPQGRRPREAEDGEKILRPMRREAPAGPPPINRDITISEGVTVKELSEKLDVKANLVIKKLVDRGIFATINQTLDAQLATDLAREFGASTSTITFEAEAMADVEILEEAKDLLPRAPVVTIMGHVDHGKTSLLDVIREANVASREAGGITQHIGAYHIEKNGRKIVFIDTPGHEAFTRMRSRGAKITDIVVLVVAADDGVMPQTIEAIDHARAAKVPIVVAINKIDRPDAQVDRIKQQLSDRGLLAEDWGGDVVMVPVSAKTKQNLDTLLEMILLVADLLDLKANPSRPAMGTVIESKLDRGRGPVATVLVRNGTLRVGDFFICGEVFGKVRALIDDRGNQVREVEPSMPVEVLGLDGLPGAGDEFQVVTDTAKAKQIVMYREAKAREAALTKNKRLTLEQLQKQMAQGEVKELNLIIKADVGGSAEVLTDTLTKLSTDKVRVRVLHTGVGAINESDVLLASASEAIIIGFNVKPDRTAAAAAEHEQVDIRLHSIIYALTDEIKKAMTGMLEPTYKEIYMGKAEVRQTFKVSKVGMVAGCMVLDGIINRQCKLRVTRGKDVILTTKVSSLKRFKDDVSDVRMGMECGIVPDPFGEIQTGDQFEAFITEKVISEVA